jgi:hypothetical protein
MGEGADLVNAPMLPVGSLRGERRRDEERGRKGKERGAVHNVFETEARRKKYVKGSEKNVRVSAKLGKRIRAKGGKGRRKREGEVKAGGRLTATPCDEHGQLGATARRRAQGGGVGHLIRDGVGLVARAVECRGERSLRSTRWRTKEW